MMWHTVMMEKVGKGRATVEMMRSGILPRRQVALVALSDLPLGKMVRLLHRHPAWLLASLWCKVMKMLYRWGRHPLPCVGTSLN